MDDYIFSIILWLHYGNRILGMTSIWMACDSKTCKDEVTGMEDSSLQKPPRREELEERWAA